MAACAEIYEHIRQKVVLFAFPRQWRNLTASTAPKEPSNIALDDVERIDRYFYAFRNEAYLYRQEGIWGICYYLAKCGFNLCRIFVHLPSKSWKRSFTLLRGMLHGFAFRPRIEYDSESNTI